MDGTAALVDAPLRFSRKPLRVLAKQTGQTSIATSRGKPVLQHLGRMAQASNGTGSAKPSLYAEALENQEIQGIHDFQLAATH